MSSITSPATSSVSPPVVRFQEPQQPSASLLASYDDDVHDGEDAPQSRDGAGGKRKSGRGHKVDPAAAAAEAETGNNTSAPVLSAKAERALRKQQQHQAAQARAQMEDLRARRSKSRSPSASRDAAEGQQRRHHDTPKKRPMRSVEDVINRIRHDSACQAPIVASSPASASSASAAASSSAPTSSSADSYLRHFSIAYIDRVWGDQEIPFVDFFSNADYKDIPLHRISYIRFFDEILWNRAARYDAVFGSSNSNKALPDWLAEAPTLRAAQEERWAILFAHKAAEAARDQQILARLDVSIAEQREEIEAMQSRADAVSAATSGFDFTESGQAQRMRDVEEAELEEMEREEDLQREAAEAQEDAEMAAAAAAGTPAISRGVSSSSSSHALREDDANLSIHLALFDSASGRVLRSASLRLSTAHFDYGFLRKRIASRLRIKGGAREVKRMYLQSKENSGAATSATLADAASAVTPSPIARSNIKLTDANFTTALTEGCTVIVMAEATSPAAMLAEPKRGGERMEQRDAARVAAAQALTNAGAPAVTPPTAVPATTGGGGVAAVSSTARPVDRTRPNWFVSLRITAASMIADLAAVQTTLRTFDSRYEDFLVPQGTFHITLSLLHIANDAEADTALRVMQENVPRMQALLRGEESNQAMDIDSAPRAAPVLTMHGLSSFGGRVLYADVARDETRARLNRVALLLTAAFNEAGVGVAEKEKKANKERRGGKGAVAMVVDAAVEEKRAAEEEPEGFTPHLTIAKLSRAPSGRGVKFNRGKNKHKGPANQPKLLQQNTGMMEEEKDGAVAADENGATDDAASLQLPPKSNPFVTLALFRDPSTASAMSDASSSTAAPTTAAAAAAGAPSAPPVLAPSTSVIRRIEAASYAAWTAHAFGTQSITSIDLCSMQAKKQADGYYFVKGSVHLAPPPEPAAAASAAATPAAGASSAAVAPSPLAHSNSTTSAPFSGAPSATAAPSGRRERRARQPESYCGGQ